MAATGKTPILLYGSTTATNQPSAGNLTNSSDGCEIAINVADKNLFFKDATNTVNTVPIRQSSASSNGWLSSTDWSTFNGKQAALISGTNIKTVSGTTLLGSGDLGTIGVGYGGTGTSTAFTAGSVVFAGASGVYTQDNTNLFWDNTNKALGIQTATPAYPLQVRRAGGAGSLGVSHNNVWSAYAKDVLYFSIADTTDYPTGHAWYVRNSTATDVLAGGWNNVGNFNVSVGNVVIGTSGKGIDFSATAGTGTSELLADYEEGTWTPVVVGTTSAGTATYSVQSGVYTKIGNRVAINLFLIWTGHTGTGDATITGLPYTSGSGASYAAIAVRTYNYALTANNTMCGYIGSSSATITLEQTPVGGGATSGAPMDSAAYLIVSAEYSV